MITKFTEHRARHHIPIYDFKFWVVVTSDMEKSRAGFNRILGRDAGDCEVGHCVGLTSRGEGRVLAMFLDADYLDHGLIAHEVFHATHSIMEFLESVYADATQEPYSALCEYLTKLVYKDLRKWGLGRRL